MIKFPIPADDVDHCILLLKVDTLRLAIGYISFLAELVANDRNPTDVLQTVVPEPPKKIFISSTKGN
jgi:hypothetical protein